MRRSGTSPLGRRTLPPILPRVGGSFLPGIAFAGPATAQKSKTAEGKIDFLEASILEDHDSWWPLEVYPLGERGGPFQVHFYPDIESERRVCERALNVSDDCEVKCELRCANS